jgi:hypothetical protein
MGVFNARFCTLKVTRRLYPQEPEQDYLKTAVSKILYKFSNLWCHRNSMLTYAIGKIKTVGFSTILVL